MQKFCDCQSCLRCEVIEKQSSCLIPVEVLEETLGITCETQFLETTQEFALPDAHVIVDVEATPQAYKATEFFRSPRIEL
jgi:hypothetical protein